MQIEISATIRPVSLTCQGWKRSPDYCWLARVTYNHAAMVKPFLLLSLLLLNALSAVTERKVIVPANAAKPVGPYSPGIVAGDYLYVSGQGVRDAQNNVPTGVAGQAKQCLDNVKAIVEAAGLTMEHVVHMQLYLERLSDLAEVERVYAGYFPQNPPARIILGTAKMPTDTPIEMTAVAVRDLQQKKVLALKSLTPLGHASAAVAVGKRVYLSAVYGKNAAEVQQKLKRALNELKATEVFRNEYGTTAVAQRVALLAMNALPEGMPAAVSVIAIRHAGGQKLALDACTADGTTIFCQAQTAHARNELNVQSEVREVMSQLQSALAKHGATFAHAVATNVYLDDINEFRLMNETYASFFAAAPPTRTTVQPFAKADRTKGAAALVRVSLVAVKD
jgi:2-iminobutanoate/2-iminopropanoate deaminase